MTRPNTNIAPMAPMTSDAARPVAHSSIHHRSLGLRRDHNNASCSRCRSQ
jgi:hypothetical protein